MHILDFIHFVPFSACLHHVPMYLASSCTTQRLTPHHTTPHHTHIMTTTDQLISCLKFQPWITCDGKPFHVQTFHDPAGGYSHRVAPVGYDRAKGDSLLEAEEARRYIRMMIRLEGAQENY